MKEICPTMQLKLELSGNFDRTILCKKELLYANMCKFPLRTKPFLLFLLKKRMFLLIFGKVPFIKCCFYERESVYLYVA